MRKTRAAKKRNSFLLRLAIVAFSVFMIVGIVSALVQIDDMQERLDKIGQDTMLQNEKNASLEKQVENAEDYKKQQAYKNGMAHPEEDVYYEIAGDE